MNENNTVIKLDNVSKRYNVYSRNIERIKGVLFEREPAEVKHALDNISLEVKEGERIAILGVVDSGRSTLLKVIADVTSPSKGKVNTFGKNVYAMLNAKVGMDMDFSCRDNVFQKASLVGIKREKIKEHVDEILEFAEVTDFADLPLKRAPKGTSALLSLGVYLVAEPEILLCDEVFGGGGNYITTKCENRFAEYMEKNPDVTILMVSNRLNYVKTLNTRTLVFNKGKIVFDGEAEEACEIFWTFNRRKQK